MVPERCDAENVGVGEQHRHRLITGLNGFGIPQASTGMDHSRDAVLRRETHRVVKRKNPSLASTDQQPCLGCLKSEACRTHPVR